MSDRIEKSFEERATRGSPRGADQVFAEALANGERRPASALGRPLVLAAAVVALLAGLYVFLGQRGDEPVELDVVAPIEVPAICSLGFEIAGVFADDPAGYCDGIVTASLPGFEPLVVVGSIEAVAVESVAGSWMIDVVPRPDLEGPVPLPPDGAGGAAMLRSSDPVVVDGNGFDVSLSLAVGHRDYRSDRNPNAWYEVMLTPLQEPGSLRSGPLFLSDWFGAAPTLACRFELGGNTICRLTDADDEVVWQTSFVDDAGTVDSVGGFERDGLAFTSCGRSEVTADCLDTIRLRWANGTLTIDLNGEPYFEQAGLPELPDGLQGEVAQWTAVVTSRSERELMRFHGGLPT